CARDVNWYFDVW
nr:immunoglobulin heavy chain junction region [Mus musculus]MBK4183990.1 immunoglobulin heavy chain junction region [Mus musculus]MBK4183993.1 immunoglobulin heavy chain junction region [Mus musculus]